MATVSQAITVQKKYQQIHSLGGRDAHCRISIYYCHPTFTPAVAYQV